MKSALSSLFILCAILPFFFLQHVSTAEEKDAGLLFERKCGTCHSIEKPKSKTKTRKEWKKTVMRMKNANMAPISSAEARLIVDYLATSYGK